MDQPGRPWGLAQAPSAFPATGIALLTGSLLALMGLGPLGAAFFLWDQALKLGDAHQIGILSDIMPPGSTALLMAVSGRALTWSVALAALILGAAVLGTREKSLRR